MKLRPVPAILRRAFLRHEIAALREMRDGGTWRQIGFAAVWGGGAAIGLFAAGYGAMQLLLPQGHRFESAGLVVGTTALLVLFYYQWTVWTWLKNGVDTINGGTGIGAPVPPGDLMARKYTELEALQ